VGLRTLKIRVFVANITNEFVLGLDILRAYDASVDIGRQMLSVAEDRYYYGALAFQLGSGQ
jgi:hypothetical protein